MSVKVQSQNSLSKGGFNPWQGWAVLCVFGVMQFMLQGSVGILSGGIKQTFEVDATAISILASSFFYSYILMQLPAGMIYDRFGIRRVAGIATLIMAVACLLLAGSPSLQTAIYSRILMGLGCSFGYIGLLTGISQWFPPQRFPFVSALGEALSMLGVAIINTVLSKMVAAWGWQVALLGCSGLAFLLSLAVWKLIPAGTSSRKREAAPSLGTSGEGGFGKDFAQLAQAREVWLGGAYAAGIFAVVSVFVALWGVPYIMAAYGADIVLATSIVSTVYLGIGLSSPLVGWAAAFISCTSLMALGAGVSFIALSLLLYMPGLTWNDLYLLMFVLGFACSVYQLPFALVSRCVSARVQGAAMGITNMVTMLSAPILQPIIALLLASTHGSSASSGPAAYGVEAYQRALLILPLSLVVAFLLTFALRDNSAPSLLSYLKKLRPHRLQLPH